MTYNVFGGTLNLAQSINLAVAYYVLAAVDSCTQSFYSLCMFSASFCK